MGKGMREFGVNKQNLDAIYSHFDVEAFKRVDPCGVVYQLMEHTTNQLDIELGALFVAMISWGSRKVFCPTAIRMLRDEMDWHPAEFIRMGAYEHAYRNAKNQCVYRTLNVSTFRAVCRNLQCAIQGVNTLEEMFENKSTKEVIEIISQWLLPAKVGTINKSACKRICMYIRWMTRSAAPDLNVWKKRSASDLYAVMDTHVLQLTQTLLTNKRPTWKACEELTEIFKKWNSEDPLKYDLALMVLADNPEMNFEE